MSQTLEQMDNNSARDAEEPEKAQKSRRPPNNAFRQQRLKAWQPILTPKTVLPLFFAVGVIFAPIGGLLLYASSQVQELRLDYSHCNDTAPLCSDNAMGVALPSNAVTSYFKNTTSAADAPTWCKEHTNVTYGNGPGEIHKNTTVCKLMFTIPDDIGPPVLLYYQLSNFYQNHRRYVQSFDQDQLQGKFRDNNSISNSDCDPLRLETFPDGTQKPYYPCGLIANSIFNDTFHNVTLLNQEGSSSNAGAQYNFTSKGTAWSSDEDLYGKSPYTPDQVVPPVNWRERYPAYNETFPIPNLHEDDAFQVWMRTAGLPFFSKLVLRNDNETMTNGRYSMLVYDYFPVLIYDGSKSVLISTHTVMGGRNPYLGITYIVVGGLCILLGGVFTVVQLIRPRKLGDHSYLSWNSDQPTSAITTGRAPRANESA